MTTPANCFLLELSNCWSITLCAYSWIPFKITEIKIYDYLPCPQKKNNPPFFNTCFWRKYSFTCERKYLSILHNKMLPVLLHLDVMFCCKVMSKNKIITRAVISVGVKKEVSPKRRHKIVSLIPLYSTYACELSLISCKVRKSNLS